MAKGKAVKKPANAKPVATPAVDAVVSRGETHEVVRPTEEPRPQALNRVERQPSIPKTVVELCQQAPDGAVLILTNYEMAESAYLEANRLGKKFTHRVNDRLELPTWRVPKP